MSTETLLAERPDYIFFEQITHNRVHHNAVCFKTHHALQGTRFTRSALTFTVAISGIGYAS
jgi:hypothetical protein